MRPSSGVKDLGLYLLLSKNRRAEHRASARTPLACKKQRQWKTKARDVIPSAGLSGLVICVGCAFFTGQLNAYALPTIFGWRRQADSYGSDHCPATRPRNGCGAVVCR